LAASCRTWTPTEAGSTLLQCELRGPEGAVASVTHRVTVRKPVSNRYEDNRPLTLDSAKCEFTKSGSLSCSVTARDPDGDRVSVNWVSTGGDTRSGDAVALPVLSTTADGGSVDVIVLVQASDRKGGEAHANLRVSVPTSACAGLSRALARCPTFSAPLAPLGTAAAPAWSDGLRCGSGFG
jgi:hypothetical protein